MPVRSAVVAVLALVTAVSLAGAPASAKVVPTTQRDFTVQRDGFDGRFSTPKTGATGPAVLVIGGSQGGLLNASVAEYLAERGFPALAVAYFRRPGLPSTLSSIPLEYFERAIEALRTQPEVDATRVVVMGASRGSEAALLLGVHYPELVSAVVGMSPANVALCALPSCDGPAWTYGGQPVTFTRLPNPSDDAQIPVEEIRGPVFLACGFLDTVWPACPMATDIATRLDDHGDRYGHRVLEHFRAGHGVGLPPDRPAVKGANEVAAGGGGTYGDNQKARRATWAALERWLHQVER